MSDSLNELKTRLAKFASDRDWDQFHAPKNLILALVGEVGELVEHFQWLSDEQSKQLDEAKQQEVAMELADIQIYLIRIADKLGVDLVEAANKKTTINESRYPVEKVYGSARRAEEYQ